MIPLAVVVDAAGNLFIADTSYSVIFEVSPTGSISVVAGNAATLGGPVGPSLSDPGGVALDTGGNLYIADSGNNRVRKVDANGTITTVAGGGACTIAIGDGGPATQASVCHPTGVAVDAVGNLYVADFSDYRVRKVAPGGTITTVAGNGQPIGFGGGSNGDGGPATSAEVVPDAVAVDTAGNLYIADSMNGRIRKVSASGIISTFAGVSATGVAVDTLGNVYLAEPGNALVQMVSPGGTITTIAGDGGQGYFGDGGPATSAELNQPNGVAVDSRGRIYIADTFNTCVRMLTPTASTALPVVSSGGIVTASAFGAFPSVAPGSWIEIYGANLASDARSWTGADFTGINAPTSLDGTKVTVGGQAAFIDYISPTQVNAQVPSNVATGSQPLIVTSAAGASAASTITVNQQQPGLLAPSSFIVGGKQYVVALFSDGVTYVLPPGAIAGIPSRRAQPGDNITLYGVGFGPVTPNIPAGQIVEQSNTLTGVLHVLFGQTQAVVGYDGLAPNAIGLYQFNVVVPNVAASDTVPVTFTLGGAAGTQTLYIAVQN
jgi:uncharacterized protein (TIGR03437 family)